MALDITNIKAQLQAKIDALDVNSTEADVLLVSKTVNQLVGSGIDLSNLQTAIQSKLDVVTNATVLKDLLLISKTIEAAGVEITQEDIIATGTNQVTAIEAAGDNELSQIAAAGDNELSQIAAAGDAELADIAAAVATEIGNVVGAAPDSLNTLEELAAAINDDADYAATVTTALGNRVVKDAPVLGGNLDGAGYTYTDLHPEVTVASVATSHDLPFSSPYHEPTMTANTTFTTSAGFNGRTMIVALSTGGFTPTFDAGLKWANDAEPAWADYNTWVISLTYAGTNVFGSAIGATV